MYTAIFRPFNTISVFRRGLKMLLKNIQSYLPVRHRLLVAARNTRSAGNSVRDLRSIERRREVAGRGATRPRHGRGFHAHDPDGPSSWISHRAATWCAAQPCGDVAERLRLNHPARYCTPAMNCRTMVPDCSCSRLILYCVDRISCRLLYEMRPASNRPVGPNGRSCAAREAASNELGYNARTSVFNSVH